MITALRNEGYTVSYSGAVNSDFEKHVEEAKKPLEEPDDLMGFYLLAMLEGRTDYYSSTVLGGGPPSAIAQIQMLGSHFRSVLDSTGLETTTLVEAMVDEALTIDDSEQGGQSFE